MELEKTVPHAASNKSTAIVKGRTAALVLSKEKNVLVTRLSLHGV